MQQRALTFAAVTATFVIGMSTVAIAQIKTADEVQETLKSQGYTQVHDINFGAEAITAKATKDGKEWSLVIDSAGKVINQSQ